MKTKIRFFTVLIIFFASALSFSKLNAQTSFLLTNNLPCRVVVGYEIGDPTGASPGYCGTCSSGSVLAISPGNTIPLPPCGSGTFNRICIYIVSIEGVPLSSNCHNDCSPLYSCCQLLCANGFISSSSSCSPGTPFNILVVPGASWTIQ